MGDADAEAPVVTDIGVKTTETHHVSVSGLEPVDPKYRTVMLHLPGRTPLHMTPQDAQRIGQWLNAVGRGDRK